ncbi:MAG TPA: BatA domain-containing protein, partial [Tepidisphaeraceae bacterium]|nr:BatA domain-containing protein [Tepidisphaeraceae bacterium]
MNFLTPLYIAGALAVALPIVFHLIRRTPRNRQPFSSLMFLTESPPRLTRRSRLSDILLLILRGLALVLLALAFARPYFYRKADMNLSASQGKRIAIMVDTSASMRRGDLWQQATQQVDRVLAEVTPADEVSLFLFGRTVHPAFTFDQWNQLDAAHRAAMLRARLAEAKPSWLSTNLGDALATVANQLAESRASEKYADLSRRQIVLVSDVQQGAHVEALQGHEWPENVLLDVRAVATKQTTNASLQLVKDDPNAPDTAAGKRLRVRVSNQPNSTSDQFAISWANDRGPLAAIELQKVYVAPGRSQVIKIDWPPADAHADRLILSGDDFDFDNTLYVARPPQAIARVAYIGADDGNDPKAMGYYLQSAVAGDSAERKTEFVQRRPDAITDADLIGARLVVVTAAPSKDRVAVIRNFLENSAGAVLWPITDPSAAAPLGRLMGVDSPQIEETSSGDYSLISRIDQDNPIFAAFSDSRFADFTKIHFWKHRRVRFGDGANSPRVIASF